MEPIIETRKIDLERGLENVGLKLRYDSKLCYCFINNQTGPEWTVESVVHECAVMHWLHNYTNYQERCNFASTQESHIHYFHDKRHFLGHMRKSIFPQIKDSIIKENGGFPSPWPWVHNMEPSPTENEETDTPPVEPSTVVSHC